MALVNSRGLLRDARANGYAVGAFNVENMEMMQAVIAAAEAEHAPVILQTTPSTLKYAEPAVFAAMARAMAGKASVPVAMHLDHGDRFGLCQQAASDGYTSLMIDGSKLPLDENIALARRVVEGCLPGLVWKRSWGNWAVRRMIWRSSQVRIFTQIQARRPVSSGKRESTL